MVCKKISMRIFGFVALMLGLLSVQKSHDLHMTKQRNLSDMERHQVPASVVSLEESHFEGKIKRYECLSGTFFVLSLISFVICPFVKRKHR